MPFLLLTVCKASVITHMYMYMYNTVGVPLLLWQYGGSEAVVRDCGKLFTWTYSTRTCTCTYMFITTLDNSLYICTCTCLQHLRAVCGLGSCVYSCTCTGKQIVDYSACFPPPPTSLPPLFLYRLSVNS